jgi:hypothetical protein
VDTSTPAGEAMAHVLATFGQFERRLISQRTKEALAVKKASGVRLGRSPTVPQFVLCRIQRLRARGQSLRAIADELNAGKVPIRPGWQAVVRGGGTGRAGPVTLSGDDDRFRGAGLVRGRASPSNVRSQWDLSPGDCAAVRGVRVSREPLGDDGLRRYPKSRHAPGGRLLWRMRSA